MISQGSLDYSFPPLAAAVSNVVDLAASYAEAVLLFAQKKPGYPGFFY